jgi:hypothetical protein
MDERQLRGLLERHNREELVWGLGIAAGSVLLWLLSYLIAAAFVLLIVTVIFHKYPHGWLVNGITAGVLVILLVDGIRHTGELFDLRRFRHSFYSIGANQIHVGWTVSGPSVTRGNPLQAAFAISQFLLCAPRSSLAAIRRLRNRTRIDDAMLARAVTCLQTLARDSNWHDVSSFGRDAPALAYLDLLGLLWTRLENGTAQVKLDPSARARYLEP